MNLESENFRRLQYGDSAIRSPRIPLNKPERKKTMPRNMNSRAHFSLSLLAFSLSALLARADITAVVVGVTPTCLYGISACWGGAYEALGHLDGIESVAKVPDEYNCTARVYLKNKGLPDIEKWHEQFKSAVGQIYVFRGVELTIEAFLDQKDGALLLRSPELETSLTLAPIQNKLQWNFKKHRPRGPEPSEWVAYEQLSAKRAEAKTDSLRVQVTGPLTRTDQGLVLEVREYFLMTPYKSSY